MTKLRRQRLSREESQARTRQRLLEAARELVSRRGFADTSTRDIAEGAGYSQGAFYSNFASKEAILLALLAEQKQVEADELLVLLEADTSAEALQTAITAWAASLEDRREWAVLAVEMQLYALRSPEFADEYRVLDAAQRHKFALIVEQMFGRLGKPAPAASETLAGLFMALVQGLAIQPRREVDATAGDQFLLVLQALIATSGS